MFGRSSNITVLEKRKETAENKLKAEGLKVLQDSILVQFYIV